MDVKRLLYALTALQLRPCYVHEVLSTTLPRLFYDHFTFMPRWRRSHYALVIGSHCVFVTFRDLSINTRIIFSENRFRFNNDTGNMKSTATLSPLMLDEQVALLMLRRRQRIWNRRRRKSCWVRPWLLQEEWLQCGHYHRLLAELKL